MRCSGEDVSQSVFGLFGVPVPLFHREEAQTVSVQRWCGLQLYDQPALELGCCILSPGVGENSTQSPVPFSPPQSQAESTRSASSP